VSTHIIVLLGGLFGPDGSVDSRGMIDLAARLKPFGGVTVVYWSSYETAISQILATPKDDPIILVGYSGGGSRATWVAGAVYPRPIKLLVAYDPSPSWQMTPLKTNVERALCYHNNTPLMLGLGGGEITGVAHIENIEIAEQHLALQYDESLHQRTIAAVKEAAA
jgi:pimeloyl-ACP methyl ester carboxylesterase